MERKRKSREREKKKILKSELKDSFNFSQENVTVKICAIHLMGSFDIQHRSRETRMNWLFKFAQEKLGRFENLCRYLSIFKTDYFFQFSPAGKLVQSPVVYATRLIILTSMLTSLVVGASWPGCWPSCRPDYTSCLLGCCNTYCPSCRPGVNLTIILRRAFARVDRFTLNLLAQGVACKV